MSSTKPARTGRPPISVEKVTALQELYLALLRLGKTEIEINAVDGMVCWDTRYRWLADSGFSARRQEAQRQGVELQLISHEERLATVYEMGLDGASNKPLVDTLKEMGNHARWKASKLNRETYGEKSETTLKGDKDNPLVTKPDLSEVPDAVIAAVAKALKESA
jgi:hypothetical protein